MREQQYPPSESETILTSDDVLCQEKNGNSDTASLSASTLSFQKPGFRSEIE